MTWLHGFHNTSLNLLCTRNTHNSHRNTREKRAEGVIKVASLGKWHSIYEVLIYALKKRDGKPYSLSKVGTTITASWVSFARTLRSFARALRGDALPL